jgi:hypothetical protein
LIPDAKHGLVTAGYGTWGKADYVTAAVADNSSWAIAYAPGRATIEVALSALRGPVRASWFDPSTGQSTPVEGSPFPNRDRHSFTTPDKNADGDADWVLVLETQRLTGGNLP